MTRINSHKLTDDQILSFYQGLYDVEVLTLFGDQMCQINVDRGLASYYLHIQSEDPLDVLASLPEEKVVQLKPITESFDYPHKPPTPGFVDDVSISELEAFGRNVGLQREQNLCKFLLEQWKPTIAGRKKKETVSEPISRNLIRETIRKLDLFRPPSFTKILAEGPYLRFKGFNSSDRYILISHPGLEYDLNEIMERQKSYENVKSICRRAHGRIDDVLVLLADDSVFPTYYGAGEEYSKTQSKLESTVSSRIDVYPLIITRAEAWASVPLRTINRCYKPTLWYVQERKRGTLTVDYFEAFAIQNPAWFSVLEVGVKQRELREPK